MNSTQHQICCPGLPLAIYREVAAHLRQVQGVEVDLIPQQSSQFDYSQSQVGGLLINYQAGMPLTGRTRVEQILAYYSDRYGSWVEF